MGLSNDLISQFVKATNDNAKMKAEKTVYGTTVEKDGHTYVRLDGSDQLTPITTTADTKPDERVMVVIKNHSATIIGNISSPAARVDDIKDYSAAVSKINELEIAIGDKVSTKDFDAQKGRIDSLQSDNALIKKSLTTAEANITELKADTADIKEKLTADEAEIENLKSTSLTTEVADAKYATIENLDITNETVHNLGVAFEEFKSHPILPDGTDLNTITTPNTYVGKNVASAEYLNVPFDSGTFILEVTESGPEGQLRQKINICYKDRIEKWVRFYYSDSWGEWIDTTRFDGTVLWSGGIHMDNTHTITFTENVSKQRNGIVLVFSEYSDGAVSDTAFSCYFVPKEIVSLKSGYGHTFILSSFNFETVGVKYLYIRDDGISGHANNVKTGTAASGIVYSNNKFVLRYVIGI